MTDQQQPGGTQPAGGWPPEQQPTQPAPPAPPWPPPPVGAQPPAPAWPPPPVGAQPPAPAWPPPSTTQPGGWAPAAAPARSTSILVILAAVFLLISGLIVSLAGSLLLLGSAIFAGAQGVVELEGVFGGDIVGAFAGMFAVVAIVVLLWGVLEVVGAVGIFARRPWGRAIGLVVGVLGLVFSGLSLLGAVGAGVGAEPLAGPTAGELVMPVVIVAGYGLTVFALLTGGAHFRRA